MRLIVMGYKEHGKDTACEILRDRFGLKFISSSQMANDLFLFEKLRREFGYATAEECFTDRVNHRSRWYQEIRDFNKDDRARLAREIFSRYPVYCGIRDRDEFEAIQGAGMVDLCVWVDASDRKPPESLESMNLNACDADLILSNNGSKADLTRRVIELYRDQIRPILAAGREPEGSCDEIRASASL